MVTAFSADARSLLRTKAEDDDAPVVERDGVDERPVRGQVLRTEVEDPLLAVPAEGRVWRGRHDRLVDRSLRTGRHENARERRHDTRRANRDTVGVADAEL